ncbi:unnamed protein product [Somion occarium]|uniref:Fungal-type protein kinase domain-containing protein n=1 Tax=Somion occarium TaxID=3059160 RepID=A0ABP1CMD5_9APHY
MAKGYDPMEKCLLRSVLKARQFLNDFMPSGRGIEAPRVRFSAVLRDATDASDISATLIQCIRESRICPGYQLVDASKTSPMGNARDGNHPQLLLYPIGSDFWQSPSDAWRSLEMHVNVWNSSADDPFHDGDKSSEACDNLIPQIAEQFSFQHRTHVFSLNITGRFARFLRWDHAGCVVSDSFDFHKNPRLLADFLWRFTFLSRAGRGFDPTTTDATPSEIRAFKTTARNFIKNTPRNVEFLRPTLDDDYPVYKVQVDSLNGKKMHLIIAKPFHGYKRPTCGGRSTRVYAAYLTSEKRLVCLKDFWRTHQLLSEAEMYQHLANHDVPHLPTNLAAGDVFEDNEPQTTLNHEYGRLWAFTHQRIVQEIAFPLETAQSSRELTQAVRDAIACMSKAWKSAQVLHQDLSDGNIMITPEGRGILNDWDCSWMKTPENPKNENRAGTWWFMSIFLCMNPFKEHEIHDDLESCLWTLIWIAARYIKSINLWDGDDNEHQYEAGGIYKQEFITYENMGGLDWRCEPFSTLMDDLRQIFADFHNGWEDFPQMWQKSKERYALLSDPENIVKLFDDALAKNGWIENDAVPNMFPYKTEDEWRTYRMKHEHRLYRLQCDKVRKELEVKAAREKADREGIPYIEPAVEENPEAPIVTKYPLVMVYPSDDKEPMIPRRSARVRKVARTVAEDQTRAKRKRMDEDQEASEGELGSPTMVKRRKPMEEKTKDNAVPRRKPRGR